MAAPATGNVTNYYRGTVFFNYGQVGWSETIDIMPSAFPLTGTTDTDAKTILNNYVNHRMWCLPAGVSAVYGRITRVPSERYSVALGIFPIAGKAPNLTTPNANDMNDPVACLCTHMIADLGKQSIRFIRGLPDDAIASSALALAAPGGSFIDLTVDPGDGSATPATLAAALKKLISHVGYNTYCASQRQRVNIGGTNKDGYVLRAFTGLILRGIRKKSVGGAFGRPRGKQPIR